MPRTDPRRRPWVALPRGPLAIAPERLERVHRRAWSSSCRLIDSRPPSTPSTTKRGFAVASSTRRRDPIGGSDNHQAGWSIRARACWRP